MKVNEQTIQQINRFTNKVAQKYPANEETCTMTNIHVRDSQESGDLMAFDDNDTEITRCVVEEWIGNTDADFYKEITCILRNEFTKQKDIIENMGILKPYNFVLEDDDKENIAELYVADDDTIIIGGDIMEGLDKDLDSFLEKLLNE